MSAVKPAPISTISKPHEGRTELLQAALAKVNLDNENRDILSRIVKDSVDERVSLIVTGQEQVHQEKKSVDMLVK